MSRHELVPLETSTGVTRAVVGWDRPLRTFFAQVFEQGEAEEETAVIWEGTGLAEIGSAAAALAIVAPYAVVPEGLAAMLEAERRDSYDHRDGPAQTEAKRHLL